jgi:Methyltransferase domain
MKHSYSNLSLDNERRFCQGFPPQPATDSITARSKKRDNRTSSRAGRPQLSLPNIDEQPAARIILGCKDAAGKMSYLKLTETTEPALLPFLSEAILWMPDYLDEASAWIEHIPFAFWIMEALAPSCFVELGTHTGVSYLAFCQVARKLAIETRGYAVDTWLGDEHTGFYGEEVFQRLSEIHDRRYGWFSRLVRTTFDEAVRHFDDGSIDLLHIDGLHTYDAVKHDFETWKPKLAPKALVLLHDTNVRERDFGVFRLWRELAGAHAHFEFLHGHGLGVLGVGSGFPPAVAAPVRRPPTAANGKPSTRAVCPVRRSAFRPAPPECRARSVRDGSSCP